jgi:acyl-CoA reductase-like NAD-dependent aldehyde dehydrogenase
VHTYSNIFIGRKWEEPAGTEGEYLVRHAVDKIAFTGSSATGKRILSLCGEQLKRVSLELGGKSAAIILDDADLGETMNGLKFASLASSGQACTAQARSSPNDSSSESRDTSPLAKTKAPISR